MKKKILSITVVIMLALVFGCTGGSRHHKTAMPDPEAFNAHFGDMDTSGDDQVDWAEFKAYFPDAKPEVFEALDLNQDKSVDHDEWHDFKSAHGLGHNES